MIPIRGARRAMPYGGCDHARKARGLQTWGLLLAPRVLKHTANPLLDCVPCCQYSHCKKKQRLGTDFCGPRWPRYREGRGEFGCGKVRQGKCLEPGNSETCWQGRQGEGAASARLGNTHQLLQMAWVWGRGPFWATPTQLPPHPVWDGRS